MQAPLSNGYDRCAVVSGSSAIIVFWNGRHRSHLHLYRSTPSPPATKEGLMNKRKDFVSRPNTDKGA